jgi:hypothetical protein
MSCRELARIEAWPFDLIRKNIATTSAVTASELRPIIRKSKTTALLVYPISSSTTLMTATAIVCQDLGKNLQDEHPYTMIT